MTLYKKIGELEDAGRALYFAGRWQAPGVSNETAARLWEDLRDALEIEPGTATKMGLGADLDE